MSVNSALRSHVTRVGFDLSLGKTHIAALVSMDMQMQEERDEPGDHALDYAGGPRVFRLFVAGKEGLIDRGLIERLQQRPEPGVLTRDIWRITAAGELVIQLLRECGIYQDYADQIPVIVRTKKAAS